MREKQQGLMVLTAGCVPAACLAAVLCFYMIIGGDFGLAILPMLLLIVFALCVVGVFLAILIALPAFVLLERYGWLNGWTALIVGGIVGLAPLWGLSVIFSAFGSDYDVFHDASGIVIFPAALVMAPTVIGVFAGWLVWRRFNKKPEPPASNF